MKFLAAWLPILLPLAAIEPQAETPAPLPPEEAAATMQVPDGFHVDLFAAEPAVRQPVALALDDRGRLWVAEAHSYPRHSDQPQHDRIVILEDVDGDGRHDRRTVFHDRLNYVTGLEVGFGGAWVMSPPYFYFIPDRDGDDVPDAEPELLLDGFGNHANSHNVANGFAWGPDGWLYGTHGRTNWSMIGKPGSEPPERKRFDGGVWRYHPTRHVWEPFTDGCTNPWGIDWDDYGQAFIPNTVDPHLFHAIQGAHYEPWRNRESSRFAYQRIETIADHLHFVGAKDIRKGLGSAEEMALGGGHSHCGILVYLGDNWPAEYRNSVFLHNTHGRRINHDRLHRRGSGYLATHEPDFLVSRDPWLMGVNFRTAPDGSVYITDWSDTGECHSTRNTRRHTGRIYRIRYGDPAAIEVDAAGWDPAELVRRQLHPNDWHVRQARRRLQELAAAGAKLDTAHATLREILAEHPETPRRLRALWALWVSDGIDRPALVALLDDDSEHLRAWAVRLLCEDREPPPAARERFIRLAAEGDSPLVRLHLASALQRLEPASRWPLAEALATRAEDVDDPNLPLMTWYGLEPLVHDDVARFVAVAERAASPLLRRHIARRVASLAAPADGLARIVDRLAAEPDPELVAGLLAGLEGRENLATPPGWRDAATALAGEPELALPALELGALFGDAETFDRLKALADDAQAPPDARRLAITRLVESRPAGIDGWLLGRLREPTLQRPALRGLARFEHPATARLILAAYPSFESVATRRDALQTLASRPPWARALLDAVEAGTIDRADLTAYTARQLQSLGDEAIADRVAALWGELRATPEAKRKRIDYHVRDLADELDQADLPAGRALYDQLCAACHRLFDAGGDLGPELTGAQRSNVEYLIENIIDPNASVSKDYQMRVIELADGRVVTGFPAAETETTVTIRTLNEEIVTPHAAIRKQTVVPNSIMPEGLVDHLSETQLRHLVGYLMSPEQVAAPEPP